VPAPARLQAQKGLLQLKGQTLPVGHQTSDVLGLRRGMKDTVTARDTCQKLLRRPAFTQSRLTPE
jgi:hypothetical protein